MRLRVQKMVCGCVCRTLRYFCDKCASAGQKVWVGSQHPQGLIQHVIHMIKIRLYVHKSDYNQLVRVKPAMIKLIRSIGHSHADTYAINATPILLFLDLGQDGDGNGTLMQCACMTIAFHILPYFFPSQHTTLVYIMHQCISSTFDLSAKIIHIISWSHFSKQFYKYILKFIFLANNHKWRGGRVVKAMDC